MARAPIYLIFLVAALSGCRCDVSTAYSTTHVSSSSQFGSLLQPPPPPHSQILPVPFHGGSRTQRQNVDVGYQYSLPPPPPPPQQAPQTPYPTDFKFPVPFYKQYNFNFVPPPQPFSTTPSPSLFQKVSTWLFPSQQTSYDTSSSYSNNNLVKKDCNPCNLVPWIPVIRYNLGAKNLYQNGNNNPTYGPPSPTAQADKVATFNPKPFSPSKEDTRFPQLSPGAPHAVYGPPKVPFNSYSGAAVSSTYGPPSPTHSYGLPSQNPISSTFVAPSSPFSIPSTTYGTPSTSVGQPSSSYLPSQQPISFQIHTTTYRPPSYTTQQTSYQAAIPVTTYGPPITSYYEPGLLNNNLSPQNDVELLGTTLTGEQELPKVAEPIGFKNSYGETITNVYAYDIPFPVSATAAESTKVKTEVLPNDSPKPYTPNMSMAVGNPAPFSLNRGRNIHTLQPVALPNLSVSPLPPIFNARPFRPVASPFPANILQGINQMQQKPSHVDITKSVPLVEFTHSVDYPTTYIQSPVIDIDAPKTYNQTKAYRNILNHFVIDELRDISSQASEDHVSATKTMSDASFESTGPEVGNDIYDTGIPSELKESSYVPLNHKPDFTDLRGLKDVDVDKYRSESNLQNIDSPLLYLKPSAPHKSFGDFIIAVSTPGNDNDFEIYDDVQTTPSPQPVPTLTSAWDESRNDYSEGLSPPSVLSDSYQPKIVQIIVPYTTGTKEQNNNNGGVSLDWPEPVNENQGRKIPSNTESYETQFTENYSTFATTTENPQFTTAEISESEQSNSAAVLNDLYDVKEPPFDIIKLQHTIDDWTEQEYSKYKQPQRTRSSDKYAKKIPDEYFTTTEPTNFATDVNYYDIFDHEGSSSIQHAITDESESHKPRKGYNTIERPKNKHNTAKNEDDDIQKPYVYTAASSFRTTTTSRPVTTTTPAPWGKIQTSISPLTKEKVYVVTSKPWRDPRNITKEWYQVEPFESKRTNVDADSTTSDSLTFKSPRFMNRPSFGFTSGGKVESLKDSSYGFSRSWYQSINELENNSTTLPEYRDRVTTGSDEVAATINRHKY